MSIKDLEDRLGASLERMTDASGGLKLDFLKEKKLEAYGRGWAFYKIGGQDGGGKLPRLEDDFLTDWGLGFLAALADDSGDWEGSTKSIEDALTQSGIRGILQGLVIAAMRKGVAESDSFVRLPPFSV
jgi:hypothetical protein